MRQSSVVGQLEVLRSFVIIMRLVTTIFCLQIFFAYMYKRRVNRVADVPQGFAPLPTNVSKTGLSLWILTWLGISPFYFSAYFKQCHRKSLT